MSRRIRQRPSGKDKDAAGSSKEKVDIDPFEPIRREVEASSRNPKGTRHIDKTRQDRMPKEERPRFQQWKERRKKMTRGAQNA